jgi:hypothetical protein
MRLLLSLYVGLVFAGFSGVVPAAAQSEPGAQPSVGAVVIDTVARRILHDYYARNADAWVVANPDEGGGNGNGKKNKNKQKHKDIPPGIAKKGTLPPGIWSIARCRRISSCSCRRSRRPIAM